MNSRQAVRICVKDGWEVVRFAGTVFLSTQHGYGMIATDKSVLCKLAMRIERRNRKR